MSDLSDFQRMVHEPMDGQLRKVRGRVTELEKTVEDLEAVLKDERRFRLAVDRAQGLIETWRKEAEPLTDDTMALEYCANQLEHALELAPVVIHSPRYLGPGESEGIPTE